MSCDQRAPFLPSYSRMLDCQCVKACQAQELYQGWLGSSWPWEHSNAALFSLGHSRGADNLRTINTAIVAVVTAVGQVCGL